jgi:hypothetical protein
VGRECGNVGWESEESGILAENEGWKVESGKYDGKLDCWSLGGRWHTRREKVEREGNELCRCSMREEIYSALNFDDTSNHERFRNY